MLYRTNEVGRAERIVYDERNPVAVGDVGHGINVYDVAIGVSQCFDEYGFGVFLYGLFEIVEVFRVDECSGDAVCRQGVCTVNLDHGFDNPLFYTFHAK